MIPLIIIILSILFQLAAAIFALRLIRITGRKLAWILISTAMVLMAVRRLVSFIAALSSGKAIGFQFPELIAFIISCLMLVGVVRIGKYFRAIRTTEEKLRGSEERYSIFLKNFCGIAYQGTLDFKPSFFHGTVEKITGYTAQDFVVGGLSWDQIIHPDDLTNMKESIENLRTIPNYSVEREYRILTKNGQEKWVHEIISNICDSRGIPVMVQGVIYDITAKKHAESALCKSEERYHVMFKSNPHPMWVYDLETLYILDVNDAAVAHYGYTRDEFLSLTIKDIRPAEDIPALIQNVSQVTDGLDVAGVWRHKKKDGTIIEVEITSHTIDFAGRRAEVVLAHDITEHKKLEAKLLHAQKMESIGQLAGGVAHDFNNILTAIIGYASLIKMKMPESDSLRPHVDAIISASDRAAHLTQSLLAFGRKQIIDLHPVNINDIIQRVEKLLIRVIGEDMDLKTELSKKELVVMADSGQIEQVLVNLATNARDAMPEGGQITIETEKVTIDKEFTKIHTYMQHGDYSLISFTDTGAGMDAQTKAKIFEPFFTTKEMGKGTGLGLSIVYGIIKQHTGYITVYSEQGKGTTFKIYLPLITSQAEDEKQKDTETLSHGKETILIVEDDESVRSIIRSVLEEFDYKVIEAQDGEEAVEQYKQHKEKIKLLILDVIMPKKDGKEVFEEIRKIDPKIKVIFTSGYTLNVIKRKGILREDVSFLPKPISPSELLKKVREALDG